MYAQIGYNDFNNLVMQTLWWLPNKILRHIHKKISVFLSRFLRICNQSIQKVLKSANNMCIKKRRISRWFRIRCKSFEKMNPKKVISKNVKEICTFSLLLMFVKLVLLVTFFWCIFYNFFSGFEIRVKFCVFDVFFDKKKKFGVILALFANFEAKCAKNGAKNQKTYFVNVS
jgi:hypothetical protein